MEWLVTCLVLVVGFAVLVSGFIEVLFIGFMIYLLCVLVATLIKYHKEKIFL
ncbi:TPA: hypothetical protein J6O31_002959 [Escherichia coli]|uniref:hypothetical protein n=1 Tax=Escherichia coli TaxID=562 RepID=UPI0012FF7A8F|nr:hypothetical protein [Escherichia coli]EEX4920953.1 hypothetical protein [Escherichia albertii]EFH5363506.1 hypothetical protein [Escherichia coli]EFJ2285714.1 hypothetical protein [Escherichia albertii]EGF4744552.1 hypothetical protein [Escherichia coli]EGI6696115.1 hypothetical protein [Escherichia coli]